MILGLDKPLIDTKNYLDTVIDEDKIDMVNSGFSRLFYLSYGAGLVTGVLVMADIIGLYLILSRCFT